MASMRPFGFPGGADPFRELRRLQEEMDRASTGARQGPAAGFPAVDIYAGRRDRGPGRAARRREGGPRDPGPPRYPDPARHPPARRRQGRQPSTGRSAAAAAFTRTSSCPSRSTRSGSRRRLENGVLRLSLPRPEEDKPRRIEIQRLTAPCQPASNGGPMPKTPTTPIHPRAAEPERVPRRASRRAPSAPVNRPVYVPRVDIVETEDALEILADMPGVTRDSVEVTLEQRVLSIRGRAQTSRAGRLGPALPGVRARRLRARLHPLGRGRPRRHLGAGPRRGAARCGCRRPARPSCSGSRSRRTEARREREPAPSPAPSPTTTCRRPYT